MKVAIRLQNHGCKNHPLWWIVIQGYYKNRRGRFLEHVGYWYPRRGRNVQRSVVLNKPRLLYWLANGAQPSHRVHQFLSWVDMMPPPLIKHGSQTLYEKPNKKPEAPFVPKNFSGINYKYKEQREREEENEWLRKKMIENEMIKQSDIKEWASEETPVDIKARSKEFYSLREKLVELESDMENLNVRQKELLIRRMNRLAYEGILKEEAKGEQEKGETEDAFEKEEITKEKIANKLKEAKFIKNAIERKEKLKHWLDLLKPIPKEEFKSYMLQSNKFPSEQRLARDVDNLYDAAKEAGVMPTKQDAIEVTQKRADILNVTQIYNPESMKENFYIPSRKTLHPFPDITKYDPEDYYAIGKEVNHQKLNFNKGFDQPGAATPADQTRVRFPIRQKMLSGRQVRPRMHYSTTSIFKHAFIPLSVYLEKFVKKI